MKEMIKERNHQGSAREILTHHASQRMNERRISRAAVEAVMTFGRASHVRGALIYAIGRKEVERYGNQGISLRDCEGIHVVCAPEGSILTVYRNHDFKGLRPSRRRYRPAA